MGRERYVSYDPADKIQGPTTTRIIGGCMHYNAEVITQFSNIAILMGDQFENYRFFVALDEERGYLALMADKPSIIADRYTRLTDTEYDMCKAVLSRVMSEELKVSEQKLVANAEQIKEAVKKGRH